MTETFKVLRLGEDAAGESHFDTLAVALPLKDFAPPARPLFISPVEESSGYAGSSAAGRMGGRMPSVAASPDAVLPVRRAVRVTASDGDIRSVTAGEAWLMADTRGKGHVTEVMSDEAFDAVVISPGTAGMISRKPARPGIGFVRRTPRR